MDETSKALTKPTEARSIAAYCVGQTWGKFLTPFLPPEEDRWAIPTGQLVEGRELDIVRSLAAPENHSGITREGEQALQRLIKSIKNSEEPAKFVASDGFKSRLATLVAFDGVPAKMACAEIALATVELTFHDSTLVMYAYDWLMDELIEVRDSERFNKDQVDAFFEHDHYLLMARFVLQWLPDTLSAAGEHQFYVAEQPISRHIIDATIQNRLERCTIWDLHRGVPAAINNRLISEVRGAIARKRPRVARSAINGSSPVEMLDSSSQAHAAASLPRIRAFGADRLVLSPQSSSSSAELWVEWSDWCMRRGEPVGERRSFFRGLNSWAGTRIRRSKLQSGAGRMPVYIGLIIRRSSP